MSIRLMKKNVKKNIYVSFDFHAMSTLPREIQFNLKNEKAWNEACMHSLWGRISTK